MIKIIGDVILDKWIYGNVDRISPEAPVPVLLQEGKNLSLGGAANVASILSNNTDGVHLYGAICKDDEGRVFKFLINDHDINSNLASDHTMTTTKTRLIDTNGQHIVRLDREEKYRFNTCLVELLKNLNHESLVIVSDYGKGVIKESSVSNILEKTKLVFVDPKQPPNYYKNAYLVKPNMKEYVEWCGEFNPVSACGFANKHGWTWLLITDGANGMHLINRNGEYNHYAEDVNGVVDVTGAGDTVIAAVVYGYDNGMSIPESCKLACYAAARSVEERRIAPIDFENLEWNSPVSQQQKVSASC